MIAKRWIACAAAGVTGAIGSTITGCSNGSNGSSPQPLKSAPMTADQIQAIRYNPNIPPAVKDNMIKSEQGGPAAAPTPPPGCGPPTKPAAQ